ncbi:MAG TPA: ATP-binding protein [Burkholderiaceae bacterium]|nr:ATP-binding protein [Burkholderiaceae bacterium]
MSHRLQPRLERQAEAGPRGRGGIEARQPPRTRIWAPKLERLGSVILTDRRGAIALAVGLVGLIAILDAATEFEIRLAVLYAIPVFLATWTAGRLAGVMVSVLAVATWLGIFQASHVYPEHLYFYWDGAVLLCTLLGFVLLVTRLRSALDSADQRFATVLEGLDAAIYVNDQDALLYVNRRFRDYFEAGSEDVGTREFESRFEVLPSDYFERIDAPGKQVHTTRGEFQERGTGRCFLVHARAVTWVDGRVVSLKVMADITEARQAAEATRQQLEKLQMSARLLTIGEIASGLAHELNQPLTAIASYNQACLKLLRARSPESEELLGYMEKCGAQAVRAGGIINRMREYARKREPLRSALDINAIVQDALRLIEVEAEKEGVAIVFSLAPDLPPVLADAIMIEQVLLNLVRNAIEAMRDVPRDRRRLRIGSARAGDDAAQVSVLDCGHGVAPEAAANLFMPFFSTKPEGMGIGLNISRSIVELHGGRLWFEPAEAGGSLFCFTLPMTAA